MIILYIMEENTFVMFVYKMLIQKKYKNVILRTALTFMANIEL